MDFTVEETNLIAIYKGESQKQTLDNLAMAYPDMDREMQIIADNAYNKVARLTAPEYVALAFAPADETEG
jgi:lauroyl/myristoyl acyltransferase